MKDFYGIRENCKDKTQYKENKRQLILDTIKPICEVFDIVSYDYICQDYYEKLIIDGQQIGCTGNSIGAVVTELINYIWINIVAENKDIGAFKKQTLNTLKRYWK